MNRTRILIIALLVVAAAMVALVYLRGDISHRIYKKEGQALSARLSEKLSKKYGEELQYNLDKFWSCYKEGIVSQNDLTDIMDRMRELRSKPEIKDLDIFKFNGYVSRTFTDAINKKHQREQLEQLQQMDNGTDGGTGQ